MIAQVCQRVTSPWRGSDRSDPTAQQAFRRSCRSTGPHVVRGSIHGTAPGVLSAGLPINHVERTAFEAACLLALACPAAWLPWLPWLPLCLVAYLPARPASWLQACRPANLSAWPAIRRRLLWSSVLKGKVPGGVGFQGMQGGGMNAADCRVWSSCGDWLELTDCLNRWRVLCAVEKQMG